MHPPIPAARHIAQTLLLIIAPITHLIFSRGHLFAALAIPLHNRIAAAARRIAKLLTRLADGTYKPRPVTPDEVAHIQNTARRLAANLLLGPDLDASYRTCAATHRPLS